MEDTSTNTLKIPATHKYVINHLINKFIGSSYIDSMYLFGSCAKGTATEDSDIDIFVVTNSTVYDDSHEAFEVLYGSTDDIPLDSYISCDILTASTEEFQHDSTPLIKTIKREGVELYGLL